MKQQNASNTVSYAHGRNFPLFSKAEKIMLDSVAYCSPCWWLQHRGYLSFFVHRQHAAEKENQNAILTYHQPSSQEEWPRALVGQNERCSEGYPLCDLALLPLFEGKCRQNAHSERRMKRFFLYSWLSSSSSWVSGIRPRLPQNKRRCPLLLLFIHHRASMISWGRGDLPPSWPFSRTILEQDMNGPALSTQEPPYSSGKYAQRSVLQEDSGDYWFHCRCPQETSFLCGNRVDHNLRSIASRVIIDSVLTNKGRFLEHNSKEIILLVAAGAVVLPALLINRTTVVGVLTGVVVATSTTTVL